MKFRHELKYIVNSAEAELVRRRIGKVLKPDPNARNGEYHVRSLYFDDYWDTAYDDKLGGFPERWKYRIRVYDLNNESIRIECKRKAGAYIFKQSLPLTLDESGKIWQGDYSFLLRREENLCHEFYYKCTSRVLRPRVYVDYERQPFVFKAGTVRITFDKNVRGAYPGYGLFSDKLVFYNVLPTGCEVLEVKFTEFLPNAVKDLLPNCCLQQSAVSKYILCCGRINYLTAKIKE